MRPHGDRSIRVLLIDPMPLARKALTAVVQQSPSLELMAAVSSASAAARYVTGDTPDVVVLDVSLPLAPQIEVLTRLRALRTFGTVLFTALPEAEQRLLAAALHVKPSAIVEKPSLDLFDATLRMNGALEAVISEAYSQAASAVARIEKAPTTQVATRFPRSIIGIGASTGGTDALATILSALPPDTPGLVIVQHMPAHFTGAFARRLNGLCDIEVLEARDGDEVRTGRALLAPGARQMTVAPNQGGYTVHIGDAQPVNGHCPSVDVLMNSLAIHAGRFATGVLLTGMGNDGAAGMKAIRDAGGVTLGQDRASSIVYGMPRAALALGGVSKVAALSEMAAHIVAGSGRS